MRNRSLALMLSRRIAFAFGFAVLAVALITPQRSAAQSSAPAATSATQASNAAPAAATPKTEEEQEHDFLYAPVVISWGGKLGLSPDASVRLFLLINFAIIFFAIIIPIARIMPKVLRGRSQTLRADLKTAREATTDAQSRLSAVEAKLTGLDAEMKQFRAQVEQESLEDEKRIKATIGEESARIVAAAEQEIGVAAAQARRGLRNFAADLAIDHAEKQLHLTPEADRALIAEFVTGVSADNGGKS